MPLHPPSSPSSLPKSLLLCRDSCIFGDDVMKDKPGDVMKNKSDGVTKDKLDDVIIDQVTSWNIHYSITDVSVKWPIG